MLEIDEKNIKSLISLKDDGWINDFTTNYYAFALGLDIPENEICKKSKYFGFFFLLFCSIIVANFNYMKYIYYL